MSNDDNLELVRRVFHEDTSEPNPKHVLEEIFAPDFICHGPPGMAHDHAGGAEGMEKCIFNNAFADLRFTVDDITPEGDRVIVRFKAVGRQVEEYQGVPPTGNEVTVQGIATFQVKGNQIAEASGSLNWNP